MKKNILLATLFVLCVSLAGWARTEQNPVNSQVSAPKIYTPSGFVSYLGPEGTYTQEACGKFFISKGAYLPFKTVKEAVKALISGKCNYAVIPQENTIGGPVIEYIDTLIEETELSIIGEVELPISQNLLAKPKTKLNNIRKVYSHKQGIAQAKKWLEKNLPKAEIIEVSSTAEGAKQVSKSHKLTSAAISSAACAEVYELSILAENIQINENNKTRFYILSRKKPSTRDSDRLAFIAMGASENLPQLIKIMDDQKMKLVSIHDRPLKTVLGEYYYLIECSSSSYDNYKKLVDKTPFKFRYLGSFEVR